MAQNADLDLRSLEIFISVVESGNMSDAARVVGVTQSAISQAIKKLEQTLGLALVDRFPEFLALRQVYGRNQ